MSWNYEFPKKSNAREHVLDIQSKVKSAVKQITNLKEKNSKEINSMSSADKLVTFRMLDYYNTHEKELDHIYNSPYFVRCEVDYENDKGKQILYFGKFSFSDQSIYSWITPAATIRFESPGNVSYIRPDGEIQKGTMIRKDQYMIVGGKIIFLATESINNPRELIHQEHFSTRKSGFILPEIVEQMEKAQDKVIRAHHVGPFVISGPAGSGKTTLALHRVAYLVQSPDTNKLYQSNKIVVFVQDNNTKDYFSHLLPELGITDVKITTFFEWVADILEIKDVSYISRYGNTEDEKDEYEYQKKLALTNCENIKYSDDIFGCLSDIYNENSDDFNSELFEKQRKENCLDRFDLTILIKTYINTSGPLTVALEYYQELKNGQLKKKTEKVLVNYSLIVIDEFQNYLAEQIKIFQQVSKKELSSILYVGDMAQQVNLGTIRSWGEINELINQDRSVVLQKVYRNTKSILKYIKTLNYNIEIPNEIKEGGEVTEKIITKKTEEIIYVKEIVKMSEQQSVGILSLNKEYLGASPK